MIDLDWQKGNGLLPTITQDYRTGKVLMLAYSNQLSFKKTLESLEAHYWSRSRRELWHKGGTSGNIQKIKEVYVDCDNDTILYIVEQIGGAACHTGHETCFHKKIDRNGEVEVVGERRFDPEKIYGKR